MKQLPDVVFEWSGAPTGAFAAGKWVFRRGEQWAVMGPNGSGKSHLAALLAGERPLLGAQLTFGGDIEEGVALVTFSQQQAQAAGSWLQARWHSLDDDGAHAVRRFLSYEEVNEIHPFEVRGDETAARAAFARLRRKVAAIFTLQPLLDRLLVQLSNGEMRRVLLARALLKSPGLLVLDDPFAGLDAAMCARLLAALDRLAAGGLPMVLLVRHRDEIPQCVTHLLTLEAMRFAGRRKLARPKRVLEPPAPGDRGRESALRDLPRRAKAGGEPVIELRGVTVRYGRRVVLDQLDWTVRKGERWLVAGPNGSGKTTLLSLITGDNPAAYANDVRVFGRARVPGASLWAVRRRIAQVSPEIQCHFDPGIHGLEAVLGGRFNAEGGLMRTTPAVREAARGWLRQLGVADAERVPFGALSAGCQRLVLLARAMLPQPDLLLLDEPCLNLDTASRRQVLAVLGRLFRERREETVICVAHRPDDIPPGFRQILRLDHRSG